MNIRDFSSGGKMVVCAYPGPDFHPADSLEHHREPGVCRGAWKVRLSLAGEVRTGSVLPVLVAELTHYPLHLGE